MRLLFVYGTLLPKLNLEISTLFRKEADFMGRGIVYGNLYDLGEYPGMTIDITAENKVYGNLYRLKNPANTLKLLDEYEGMNMTFREENEYIRAQVNVFLEDKEYLAETYLYLKDVSNVKRIGSGDYLTYLGLSSTTHQTIQMDQKQIMSSETLCVQETRDPLGTSSHTLPLYATSSFVFDNLQQGIDIFSGLEKGYLYSRFGNPTCDAVAEKIARLEAFGLSESGHGQLVSSGMAAISAVLMALLKPGDKLITQGDIYGGTTDFFKQILEPHQISFIEADLNDIEQVEALLAKDTSIRLIYLESPTNPLLTCVHLERLVHLAKKYHQITVIDNTFCTPMIQQPLQWGIDYVVHSTTKYLNGHGNSISGCIIGKNAETMQRIKQTVKWMGCNANPWDAWLLHNGLKTLAIRIEKQSTNAMALATYLSKHPSVAKVYYPGLNHHKTHEIARHQMKYFGGMLSFEVKGGIDAAKECINKLKIATLAPTLGDIHTLIMHPFTMSHRNVPLETREKFGIREGLIRVSVGIESSEDLIQDFRQSLNN